MTPYFWRPASTSWGGIQFLKGQRKGLLKTAVKPGRKRSGVSAKRKGLRNVRTAQKGGVRSRPRRPDDALNELALLMRERDRLNNEHESCEERMKRISSRLNEIAEMERYLRGIADPLASMEIGKKLSSGRPWPGEKVILHY